MITLYNIYLNLYDDMRISISTTKHAYLLDKHPGGLETGPIFQTKLQVRSTFPGLTCGGHEIFAQHVCVSPLPSAAVGQERAIYFPRPLRTQGIWHPIFDVLPKNVNIRKPPICVASNMCASSRNVNIPKKPVCVVQICVQVQGMLTSRRNQFA